MRHFLSIFLLLLLCTIGTVSHANIQNNYENVSGHLVEEANQAILNDELEKAVRFFHQAMVANPQNTSAYVGLGGLYSAKGRYSMGLKYYNIALSIDPIDIFALEGLLMTHLKRNDFDGAKESFLTMQQVCEFTQCEQFNTVEQAMKQHEEALFNE